MQVAVVSFILLLLFAIQFDGCSSLDGSCDECGFEGGLPTTHCSRSCTNDKWNQICCGRCKNPEGDNDCRPQLHHCYVFHNFPKGCARLVRRSCAELGSEIDVTRCFSQSTLTCEGHRLPLPCKARLDKTGAITFCDL